MDLDRLMRCYAPVINNTITFHSKYHLTTKSPKERVSNGAREIQMHISPATMVTTIKITVIDR